MYNPLLVWVNVCPLCVVVSPPEESELLLSLELLDPLSLPGSLLELGLGVSGVLLGFGGGVEF